MREILPSIPHARGLRRLALGLLLLSVFLVVCGKTQPTIGPCDQVECDLRGEVCCSSGCTKHCIGVPCTGASEVCLQSGCCSTALGCGDRDATGTEECDGPDLRGKDCTDFAFAGGTLGCRFDCTYDTCACTNVPAPRPAGSACVEDVDCSSGLCLDEASIGFPGGYCSQDCALGPCPTGEVCVPGFGASCAPTCASSQGDCRDGYDCFDGFASSPFCHANCTLDTECPDTGVCSPWTGFCDPDFGLGRDGASCTFDDDCESFICLTEFSGYPNGYCTSLCSLETNVCPGDGVCSNLFGLLLAGGCLDGCTADADCRTAEGYTCQPADGACHPR